jgi:hypothetical protein
MNRLICLLLAFAAVSVGCRKPLPSPDFIEASGRYTNLLAVQGDRAYSTGDMDEVVAQLGRVSQKSSDFQAAQTMAAKIASERARIAKDQEAAAAALNVPVAAPSFPPLPVAPAEPVKAPEAPKAPEDPFAVVVGAAWAPLQAKFFGCFISRGPITMLNADGGSGRETEGWELHDSADCRRRVPALIKNVAMVQDGKIMLIAAVNDVKTTSVPVP